MDDVWGPYRIVRVLGQGSMGRVYVAADDIQLSVVALKIIPLGGDGNRATLDAARGLFLAEAHSTRKLRHAHITSVINAGEKHGHGWLAMELAPGVDLSRYTSTNRLLPQAVVAGVGAKVAQALAHAHGLGIVHRDVKPSNVLVDWASNSLKLTDFGLARTADALATRTGVVLGSPAFLAPEQLAGAPADTRSDIYALGVTLFQLLSGSLPFAASTLGELLAQVARKSAPALGPLHPGITPALADLVASMLQKSAQDRPAMADVVASELAAVVRGLNA